MWHIFFRGKQKWGGPFCFSRVNYLHCLHSVNFWFFKMSFFCLGSICGPVHGGFLSWYKFLLCLAILICPEELSHNTLISSIILRNLLRCWYKIMWLASICYSCSCVFLFSFPVVTCWCRFVWVHGPFRIYHGPRSLLFQTTEPRSHMPFNFRFWWSSADCNQHILRKRYWVTGLVKKDLSSTQNIALLEVRIFHEQEALCLSACPSVPFEWLRLHCEK